MVAKNIFFWKPPLDESGVLATGSKLTMGVFHKLCKSAERAYQLLPDFQSFRKIVQLYDEKVTLLERLLASKKEKNELLKGKK